MTVRLNVNRISQLNNRGIADTDLLNSHRCRWDDNIWFCLDVVQIRCANVAWLHFRMWSLVNCVIKPFDTFKLPADFFFLTKDFPLCRISCYLDTKPLSILTKQYGYLFHGKCNTQRHPLVYGHSRLACLAAIRMATKTRRLHIWFMGPSFFKFHKPWSRIEQWEGKMWYGEDRKKRGEIYIKKRVATQPSDVTLC